MLSLKNNAITFLKLGFSSGHIFFRSTLYHFCFSHLLMTRLHLWIVQFKQWAKKLVVSKEMQLLQFFILTEFLHCFHSQFIISDASPYCKHQQAQYTRKKSSFSRISFSVASIFLSFILVKHSFWPLVDIELISSFIRYTNS